MSDRKKELMLLAAYHIETYAAALRESNTTADGEWDPDDQGARLEYQRHMQIVDMLRREAGVPTDRPTPPDVVTPAGPEVEWHDPAERVPETLHDVVVIWSALGDDMDLVLDMAYRRNDGQWVLTGSEPDLIIRPWAWTPLPAPPDDIPGRAQI
jgi:nucleotide-binding universal stress UspA family protein